MQDIYLSCEYRSYIRCQEFFCLWYSGHCKYACIIVFPQANPNGHNYNINSADAMWRKNRHIHAPNSSSGDCVGVDINRNYDFVLGLSNLLHSLAPVDTSTDPCDHDVYHGSSAFSEPENS